MALDKFQHPTKEIDGKTYRIIETGISKNRADFLVQLLTHNKLETILETDPPKEGAEQTYTIITPDVTFNPIVKVYNRELRTLSGHRVTPDIWNQLTDKPEPNYWDLSKKPK
ncbi:MAG TPA: hypothetical protein PLV21_10170 [Cyclobacteriaceae bacterium]|nr:hypothetical protein [Cyclobacteriaceae bacterium]HRJ82240.1 hypothetical protein [Cyclobacteriaceae bacterium]